MKKHKYFAIVLLCITLLLSTLSVNATENGEMVSSLATPRFIEICVDFFNDVDEYSVLNAAGSDVTEQFKQENQAAFNNGDYDSIWSYFCDGNYVFSWSNEESIPSTRGTLHVTASDSFYTTVTVKNHTPKKTIEVGYTITGRYDVNDLAGTIMAAFAPTVDITYGGLGSQFTASTNSISTDKRISSDKKTVTFSAQFYTDVIYHEYVTGAGLWTERLGPIKGSVTGRA